MTLSKSIQQGIIGELNEDSNVLIMKDRLPIGTNRIDKTTLKSIAYQTRATYFLLRQWQL